MFVYIWENKLNGKRYIGKCQNSPKSSYIGSGKYFKRAVKKYGIENFERTILEFCDSPAHLVEREQYYLNKFDAANSKEFYNISPNSGGGHHGADYGGRKNPMYGKKHPNHVPHHGKNNGMYGVRRCGSDNPNSKPVKIIEPSGKIHTHNSVMEACQNIFGNLEHYGKMKHMVRRTSKIKQMRSDSSF